MGQKSWQKVKGEIKGNIPQYPPITHDYPFVATIVATIITTKKHSLNGSAKTKNSLQNQ